MNKAISETVLTWGAVFVLLAAGAWALDKWASCQDAHGALYCAVVGPVWERQ